MERKSGIRIAPNVLAELAALGEEPVLEPGMAAAAAVAAAANNLNEGLGDLGLVAEAPTPEVRFFLTFHRILIYGAPGLDQIMKYSHSLCGDASRLSWIWMLTS